MGRTSIPLPQLAGAPPTGWQRQARCAEVEADVFFPPAHGESRDERLAREASAKAICGQCPVREPCLAWALQVREPHGVWGGYSEAERRQILLGRLAAV